MAQEYDALDYDFTIFQGDTFIRKYFFFIESDGEEIPLDLSGSEFRGQVKLTINSQEKITDIDISLIKDDNDLYSGIELVIDSDITSNLCATDYVYDVEKVNDQGEFVEKVMSGKIYVNAEVTKWIE